ncbi:MAG: 16S rRNA (cytosine(1402)-N(4))-methyltransferase RsmH [Bacteroidia bacterium]|nr:16S rRNA (cytosine(1402)-N(4))-methyltransferase RsmH [Bacteroidia bacterium]MBP9688717.1 16S rRNA (cytosine(1402)-N(4))-methyltransferase RsmH [Bacteroidia bacterium]
MSKYHVPVMLNECLDGLNIKPDGVYVDVTFGGGGHSRAILEKLGPKGKLIAFDQDEDAKANIPKDDRLIFIDQNFEFIKNHIQYQGLLPVDGILADLGVSSHQFDVDERGFSYRFDEAILDMRMDRTAGKSAADILNTATEAEIADMFYYYGELNQARSMAKQIIVARQGKLINTVADLKNALNQFAPKFKDYKFWSQVFQALRIEVNRELEVLKSLLNQCADVIKPEGRLVVMSYHSLEDRLVKNYINTGNFKGELEKDFYGNPIKPFTAISKRAATANAKELEENTRSRSSKLRIAQRNQPK